MDIILEEIEKLERDRYYLSLKIEVLKNKVKEKNFVEVWQQEIVEYSRVFYGNDDIIIAEYEPQDEMVELYEVWHNEAVLVGCLSVYELKTEFIKTKYNYNYKNRKGWFPNE